MNVRIDVEKKYNSQGVVVIKGNPYIEDATDSELIENFEFDFKSVSSIFGKFIQAAEKNKKYYVGEQVDEGKLKVGEAKVVVNRVFVSTETGVSQTTQVTPDPWIIVTPEGQSSKQLEEKLIRALRDEWEVNEGMQKIMEIVARNRRFEGIGLLKVEYDEDENRFITKHLTLRDIMWDIDASLSIQESRFVVERMRDPLYILLERYPKKAEELKKLVGDVPLRSEVVYYRYWSKYKKSGKTKIYRSHIYKNIVLDKELHPDWNDGGAYSNHFNEPMYPYITMSVYSIGESLIDPTTEIEQGKSLQDSINRRKRQIDKSASRSAGKYVTSALAMDVQEAASLDQKDVIVLSKDVENVNQGLAIVSGRPIEEGAYNDYFDSKAEIDNVFGTHAATRGEASAEKSVGGKALLKQSDIERLSIEARTYNEVAEDWYNYVVQLMYVHLDKPLKILTSKDTGSLEENYKRAQGMARTPRKEQEIVKKDFKGKCVKVIVKRGATRPRDPATLANDAVMLRQTGFMNPRTFFELAGIPNAERHARYEFLWAKDPASLFPELQGPKFIHPMAVDSIRQINSGGIKSEDEIKKLLLQTIDPEEHLRYVQTVITYMTTGEVDDDTDKYHELDDEIQALHQSHLEFATGRLQTLKEEEERKMAEQGQVIPAGSEETISQIFGPPAGESAQQPPMQPMMQEGMM